MVLDFALHAVREGSEKVGFRNQGQVLLIMPFALALNRIFLNKIKRFPEGVSTIRLKYYERSTRAQFFEFFITYPS